MNFGALIIGDEILSGRRDDKHMIKLIELLGARGLKLSWARYAGDSPPLLETALRETLASGDIVFSFGGIGATPDAERLIREKFGDETTAHRLKMGVYPTGAEVIPNPYNQIPGFSIARHYFVPGFPVMAWPMVEWVLDTHYAHLHHAEDYVERSVVVWDAYEGRLIDLMEAVTADFPDVTLFSLPAFAEGARRHRVELGVKGPAAPVDTAMGHILTVLAERGYQWDEKL